MDNLAQHENCSTTTNKVRLVLMNLCSMPVPASWCDEVILTYKKGEDIMSSVTLEERNHWHLRCSRTGSE